MSPAEINLLLADLILVVHVLFVLFAVLGFLLIVFGRFAGWSWIYNGVFRILHLVAIGFVVIQAWLGRLCPLTVWENALRSRAGQGAYEESFIQHWLQRLLYYDFEPWVFIVIYTVFGVLILAATMIDREKIGRPRDKLARRNQDR
jgi:polyferredoxin